MASKKSIPFSHWYHLIEGLQESSQKFYVSLEQAITKHQISGLKISRKDYKEGGIFSAKREYLRVQWKKEIFDICAAPFGDSFFISWWLGETPSPFQELLLAIPFIGAMFAKAFKPMTFFQMDSVLMFEELIHSAVLSVIDNDTKAGGLRSLSEAERKPIMRDLFKSS
jgi:hypothetical protein